MATTPDTDQAKPVDTNPASPAATTTDDSPASPAATTPDADPASPVATTPDASPASPAATFPDDAPAKPVDSPSATTPDADPASPAATFPDDAPAKPVDSPSATTPDALPAKPADTTQDDFQASPAGTTPDADPASPVATTPDAAPASPAATTPDANPAKPADNPAATTPDAAPASPADTFPDTDPASPSDTTPDDSQASPLATPLIRALFADPTSFGAVQVTRLLHAFFGQGSRYGDFLRSRLHIRPHLSLAFPPSDVIALDILEPDLPGQDGAESDGPEDDPQAPAGPERARPRPRKRQTLSPEAAQAHDPATLHFRLTVSFLGLYGAASPMPTFYTEDLLDEAREDLSAGRDFLDLVNASFYELFLCGGWFRYRPMQAILEQQDDSLAEQLLSLGGLGAPFVADLPHPACGMAAFTGLLNQFPRSAAGLQAFLGGLLDAECTVFQCAPGTSRLPEDQRTCLGLANGELGESAILGREREDCTGRLAIRLAGLSHEQLLDCTGPEGLARLRRLVDFYCTEPFDVDWTFVLAPHEVRGTCLGEAPQTGQAAGRQCLGQDTWLGQPEGQPPPGLPGAGTATLRGRRWQDD